MPLLNGFVALVDVLGFKGIWNRTDPDAMLLRMKSLEGYIDEELCRYAYSFNITHGGRLKMQAAFLSDTVAIGVGFEQGTLSGNSEEQLRYSFSTLGFMLLMVVQDWAQKTPAMALRGCVSAGTFVIERGFLLGKAIDEAAEYHEMAEGAFIWMAPSAVRASGLDPDCANSFGEVVWRPWSVPLKLGALSTLVLDMTCGRRIPGTDDERPDLIEPILSSFSSGGSLSVEIKRQNTERFLRQCKEWAEDVDEEMPL